jgi:hypothetical protein
MSPWDEPRAHATAAHTLLHRLHGDTKRRGGLPHGQLIGIHALTVARQADRATRSRADGRVCN